MKPVPCRILSFKITYGIGQKMSNLEISGEYPRLRRTKLFPDQIIY